MANYKRRVRENVEGSFFVDDTCIDCDTCRQLAPTVFGEAAEYAYVKGQPKNAIDERAALRALVACPTASIGCRGDQDVQQAVDDFPLLVDDPVYYCGFNSRRSYGGNSYFVQSAAGNWMIDSPRYATQLVQRLEQLGGIKHIFLTHSDDVADAHKFAGHFGATRYIHREELEAQPDAEVVLETFEPQTLEDGLLAIPTPGHTAGHCVLLLNDRFLFTGDHLYWDRAAERLGASRDYCWDSWARQVDSMRRLANYRFEWILPGHGQRVQLPPDEMQRQMRELLKRMT